MTRSEEGISYAIDLGGTSFRVLKVELGAGSTIINRKVEHQPIPENLTKGTSDVCFTLLFHFPITFSSFCMWVLISLQDLFNFIASALKNFIEREGGEVEGRALGFTFSFPVRQTSISSGTLIRWTKEFSIEEAVSYKTMSSINLLYIVCLPFKLKRKVICKFYSRILWAINYKIDRKLAKL